MLFFLFFAGCSSVGDISRTPSHTASPIPSNSEEPLVQTRNGLLHGLADDNGNIFLGIPYAAAPGRFRAAKPASNWSGVREAKSFAPVPLQKGKKIPGSSENFYFNSPVSEDCLYLNVWAPKSPGPHPVFVWIYGGANISGATNDPAYDGSSFARDGIVFVSIAYRVGAWGFLELGNELGKDYFESGNNGLLDLQLGLQWVHDNIRQFGGDPAQVTLGGHSAGAKNAVSLLSSPLTEGLIQQALIDSGGAQTVASLSEAEAVTQAFFKAAHIPKDNPKKILSLSADQMLEAQDSMIKDYPRHFPFRAIRGGRLLPKWPLEAVRTSRHPVPLFIATCKDESAAFYPPTRKESPIRADEVANADMSEFSAAQKHYAEKFFDWDVYTRNMRALTAEEYWIPSIRLAEAQVKAGGQVWMYRFDHLADSGWLNGFAGHGSDLIFAFNPRHELHALWSSFITGGQPQTKRIPAWPQYSLDRRTTELVNDNSVVAEDPASSERKIWNGLLN